MVMYRGNREKDMGESNGHGVKGARKLTTSIVLGSLEDGEEGGLTDVGEPYLGCVSEDGDAYGMEDFAPRDELQALDGVSKDTEGPNEAAHVVGHGADVKRPIKLGGEEDPKVAEGGSDRNAVGCDGTRGEDDRSGRGSEETGRELGGVKEHKLCLVEVDGEAGKGKPGTYMVPRLGDFVGSRKECGPRGVDAPIIDVEGEVLRRPESGGVKEWSSKKSGEDGGEGGALRSALCHREGVQRIAIEVKMECHHQVTGAT